MLHSLSTDYDRLIETETERTEKKKKKARWFDGFGASELTTVVHVSLGRVRLAVIHCSLLSFLARAICISQCASRCHPFPIHSPHASRLGFLLGRPSIDQISNISEHPTVQDWLRGERKHVHTDNAAEDGRRRHPINSEASIRIL